MPKAVGFFIPDAFNSNGNWHGITWVLSHVIANNGWETNHSILLRLDCDLSLDVDDPDMKNHYENYRPEFFYQRGLNEEQIKRIENQNKELVYPK